MSSEHEDNLQVRLISTLVLSSTALTDYRQDLTPALWTSPDHKRLVGLVLALYDSIKSPPTKSAVLHEIERRAIPDSQAGTLRDLVDLVYSPPVNEVERVYVDRLAYMIRETAYQTAAEQTISLLDAGKEDPKRFDNIDEVWNKVRGVGQGMPPYNAIDLSDDEIDASLSEDAALYDRRGQVLTGYPTVDRLLKGGPARGEFHLTVGAPNTGKTRYVLNVGKNGAFQGANVAHISAEMSRGVCRERLWQIMTNQSVEDLHTKEGRSRVRSQLAKIKARGGNYMIWDIDPYTYTMNDVEALLISSGIKFDILITDYIDLFLPAGKSTGNYWVDQTMMYAEGRRVARRLDLIHHSVCQPTDQAGEIITLRNASGSKGKGATVDFMMSLNANEEQEAAGIQIGYCGKNRYGPRHKVWHLNVNPNTGLVVERPKDDSEEPDAA